jgi:lipid A ethanolaminephosphotransferase
MQVSRMRSPRSAAAHHLALGISLWIATIGNWPLWQSLAELPENASWHGLIFGLAFAGIVGCVLTFILMLFAWPRLIRIIGAVFLLSAAFGAYFMGAYGVVIDASMMTNALQTDAREVRDLLNLRLLGSVALFAGVPLWWLWRTPVKSLGFWPQLWRNGGVMLVCTVTAGGLLYASFADMSSTMRNHKSIRYRINPLNAFYALGMVTFEANAKPKAPPLPIGKSAHLAAAANNDAAAKPPLMLLVVGETARADHFALNGYSRPTNPELSSLGVVSFTQVTSCGTNTAASVPCMFSFLGRESFVSRAQDHENLLDLLDHLGMAVLWIDNQAGCKGVCARVPSADAWQAPANNGSSSPPPADLCEGQECFDMALLHGIDQRIAALPAEKRAKGVLIVFHQMGSHGPAYYLRSPKDHKPFLPECTTNALQQCQHDELINAYDNTIAYTDHVLASGIHWLDKQTANYTPSLLYFSDHGESLGENNLYLHGLPYSIAPTEQKHVPMIVWWPSSAEKSQSLSLACLQTRRNTPLSHDHLFHTVVGWFGISTPEYKPEMDAFRPCKAISQS